MRIRILDRILVAIAGVILVAVCAGIVAQVFFGKDVVAFAEKTVVPESTTGRVIVGVSAGVLLLLGLYCVLMLFRHRRRKDKFILQKLESGELAISLKTLETMVTKCLDQHKEITSESIHLENQRDGLLIRVRGTVAGGISIPLTVDTMQKQIKQYVTACSGVEVKDIRIQIEASGSDAKDAPFSIEPPTSMLLTKGTETADKPAFTQENEETAREPAVKEPAAKEAEAEPAAPAVKDEAAAAAAAMAAAENLMQGFEAEEDDRPIHQRLFSTQEEPCIMPLSPENLAADGDKTIVSSPEAPETKENPEDPETAEKTETTDVPETAEVNDETEPADVSEPAAETPKSEGEEPHEEA